MSSRSLDIESPMVLLLAMHHPWEFQKISIETFRSFLLDFTLWLLHQKMCFFFFFRGIYFGSKTSQISEGFGWNLQKFSIFWPQINVRKKTTYIFALITSFWAHIFQWYILVFFGCCCSPCSSGGCCWYPCHGSHLIRECATHCCVGIFALSVRQKVLGDLIDKIMFLLGREMKKAGQFCPKQYGSG